MFRVKEDILNEFAVLCIDVGINIAKGQPLLIQAPVEAYELVRVCSKRAYELGASKVMVDYYDGDKNRMDYLFQDEVTLCDIPAWSIDKVKTNIESGYARLIIESEDPDLLKGIDAGKIKNANIARMKAMQPYFYYTSNSVGQWCIVAYPELKWAKKMFPHLSDDEAMEVLWDAILQTSRVEIGKTKENWEKHCQEIGEHCQKLNEYNFKSLHFKNSVGTDLVVNLIKDHIWQGGNEVSSGKYKRSFNANIPTEEVFTMPDCYNVNGKVVTTKPLSYNGNLIPQFSLTFRDGVVVEYSASENEEILKNLLETDEGSKRLGEVALISDDSPISNSGILFYNTLFDENASCHLALGACYPTNVRGGEKLESSELQKIGGNDSMNHVDFMFGSKDMSIIGTTYDGKEVTVFRDGNFVI